MNSIGLKGTSGLKSLGSGFQLSGSNYVGQKGKVAGHSLGSSIHPSGNITGHSHSLGSQVVGSLAGNLTDLTSYSNSVHSHNMPVGLKKSPLEKR